MIPIITVMLIDQEHTSILDYIKYPGRNRTCVRLNTEHYHENITKGSSQTKSSIIKHNL